MLKSELLGRLVRWSAEDLARESAVGVATIRRAEAADGETSMTAANDLAVRRALETAGVEFIDDNGGGPGFVSASGQVPVHNRLGGAFVATWNQTSTD